MRAVQESMPEPAADSDLLRLMQAGDEPAFTALYRKYQGVVYRFGLHMSGSPGIAEEITQEAFLILIRDARRYDARRATLGAFLCGIARHLVCRALERDQRYVLALDDPRSEHAQRASEDGGAIADLARNETIESVRRAVLALPPSYREAIVLCDLEELDYAEAASVLGCAVGTVRSRLHRARALLTAKLRAAERCSV